MAVSLCYGRAIVQFFKDFRFFPFGSVGLFGLRAERRSERKSFSLMPADRNDINGTKAHARDESISFAFFVIMPRLVNLPRVERSPLGSPSPLVICCLAAAALGLMGCASEIHIIELDEAFSYNIAAVPSWFPPDDEALTPVEREVIRLHGSPDFIRFWWRPDGTFITSSDIYSRSSDVAEMLKEAKRTWIYYRGTTEALTADDIEIEFDEAAGFKIHPLSEQLKMICFYGDPSIRNVNRRDSTGLPNETWIWVDHGLQMRFVGGRITSRKAFAGTGGGTWRAK